jgi:hypothetical protein
MHVAGLAANRRGVAVAIDGHVGVINESGQAKRALCCRHDVATQFIRDVFRMDLAQVPDFAHATGDLGHQRPRETQRSVVALIRHYRSPSVPNRTSLDLL